MKKKFQKIKDFLMRKKKFTMVDEKEKKEKFEGLGLTNEESVNSVPLNKIQRLKKEIIILRGRDKKTKKKFKMPKKLKMLLKKKKKKPDYVVVQYLTMDYEVRFKLCKIVSGNLVVIENKVHKLDSSKIWRLGKNSYYILREIDRNPVSNDDYQDVKDRGDDTDADVPLIKAVLGAVQKQKSSSENNKNVAIVVGVIAAIVIAVVLFMK